MWSCSGKSINQRFDRTDEPLVPEIETLFPIGIATKITLPPPSPPPPLPLKNHDRCEFEIRDLMEKIEFLELEINSCKSRVTETSEELKRARSDLDKEKQKNTSLLSRLDYNEEIREDSLLLKQENINLQSLVERLTTNRIKLENENQRLSQLINDKPDDDEGDLKKEIVGKNQQLKFLEAQLDSSLMERDKLNDELQKVRRETNEALSAEISKLIKNKQEKENELHEKISILYDRLHKLKKENSDLTTQLNDSCKDITSTLQQAKDDVSRLTNINSESNKKIISLENRLSEREESIKIVEEDKNMLIYQVQELNDKLEAAQRSLSELPKTREQIEQLMTTNNALRKKIDEYKQKASEKRNNRSGSSKSSNSSVTSAQTVIENNVYQEKQLLGLQLQVKTLQTKLDLAKTGMAKKESELAEVIKDNSNKLQQLKREIASLRTQLEAAKKDIDKRDKQISNKESELANIESTADKYRQELTSLLVEIGEARQAKEEFKTQLSGKTKSLLELQRNTEDIRRDLVNKLMTSDKASDLNLKELEISKQNVVRLKREIESVQVKCEERVRSMSKEITDLKTKLIAKNSDYDAKELNMIIDISQMDDEITRLLDNNDQLKTLNENYYKQLQETNSNMTLKEELWTVKESQQLADFEKTKDDLIKRIKLAEREIETLTSSKKKEDEYLTGKIDQAEKKIQDLKSTNRDNLKTIQQLKQRLDSEPRDSILEEQILFLRQKEKQLEQTIIDVQRTNANLYEELAELKQSNEVASRSSSNTENLESQVATLKREINDLKTANSRLRFDRDQPLLNYEKREAEIVRKYLDLYNNEWTDVLNNKEGLVRREQRLLNLVLNVYADCVETIEKQLIEITKTISGSSLAAAEASSTANITDEQRSILMEYLKTPSALAINVSRLKTVLVDKYIQKRSKELNYTIAYIEKCVEVCYYMATEIPPLRMVEKSQFPKAGDKISIKQYSAYKTSGDYLDYVVWPPLLRGGKMIHQGVAEFKKTQAPSLANSKLRPTPDDLSLLKS